MSVQKVMVLKVHMCCDKSRTKALKTAAEASGVTSVRLEGEDQERLRVEGCGVNVTKLVQTLIKNVGYTEIHYVSDI
ncbi:unnamed protein product [Cochlearia groenlandica]